ncbi:MAG TPA: hypothetical protein VLV83_02880 [Acidobacteriota bacterium]|nr:hypothetical protein [Acidobacteriota bacterium]
MMTEPTLPAVANCNAAKKAATLLWVLLALASASACGASGIGNLSQAQPEEQYQAAMDALYQGDLWGFYGRLAPASYTQDLNALLDKGKTLLDEEEYRQARRLIQATSRRLQEQLNSLSEAPPQADLIATALQDVPASLGIETWDKFRRADVESIIKSLQQSSVGDALRDPQSPVEWSRQKVERIDIEDSRATLRVAPAEGPGEVKEVELVKVDDKWVPADVARTWEARINSLNSRLDAWIAAKEQDPDYVKKRLDGIQEQLDLIVALIPALLLQLQQMEQP